ncbi:MAG: response regulator [Nevskia sp.]|nr:response regulator [Nevskia sp.]
MRLLLIEDDTQIAASLARALRHAGDAVDVCGNARDAEEALRAIDYALVILDLGLPDQDGGTLLRSLRTRDDHTPVLVLTARDELDERVRLLDLGADDYLVKPFELAELQARIRAITRRAIARSGGDIGAGRLRLDLAQRCAYCGDAPLDLSPRELKLLELLLLRRDRVVSKTQIQEQLCDWGQELTDGAVELYIHRLRRKLDASGVEVRTVRGFGYLLQLAAEAS